MNPNDKQVLLQSMGSVSAHLHDDIVQLEHKILQTGHDIFRLKARADELRARKEAVFEDDGDEGVAIVDSIGVCLTHLGIAISQMENKKATFEFALRGVRAAVEELNMFGNGVAGIPNV